MHALSIAAFHNTVSEREAKCHQLMGLYLSSGAKSDREASYLLDWDRSDISARRNDLLKLGKVCELGQKKDSDTGREVAVWGVIKNTLDL